MVQYRRPPKRARVQQECLRLDGFGAAEYPADFSSPFRSNVREFLNVFGRIAAQQVPGVQKWCIPMDFEKRIVNLIVLEELPFESGVLHCNHCRIIGWSHHPVCRARYHFILPAAGQPESLGLGKCEALVQEKGNKLCNDCGSVVGSSVPRCPSCGLSVSHSSVLEANSHLLHGIIHSNGYGHLLRVNGREGGSSLLSGTQIMNLWDRICTMLRARKVSVLDASKKFGLKYHLLHAVAKGQCWYGLWGYRFAKGCYGISENIYRGAISQLVNTPLSSFLRLGDRKLHSIISYYQMSPDSNLQNFLGHIMELLTAITRKRLLHTEETTESCAIVPNSTSSACSQRWSTHRLEKTLDVLVSILRQFGLNNWMPRPKLRERARNHIGDTGLLDHSLCSFVGKVVDGQVVQRRHNEQLRQLEYRLTSKEAIETSTNTKRLIEVEFSRVLGDLRYVYDQICGGELLEEDDPIVQSSKIVLDTKHFIKDYQGNLLHGATTFWDETGEEAFRVQCRIELSSSPQDNHARKIQEAPSELVVLPRSATIGDLKREAIKAFRDVYPSFSKLWVTVPVLEGTDDEQPLKLEERSTSFITMKGAGIDNSSAGRFEKGLDDWVVNCCCGAQDDDGERMAACDACGVWSHTRCARIPDSEDVPLQFFCRLHAN